jgi:putative heme-binding domain-containing protein
MKFQQSPLRFVVLAFAVLVTVTLSYHFGADPNGPAGDAAAVAADAQPLEWAVLRIPDAWKKPAANNSFTWYRCFVEVPETWKGGDLELFVEAVDDAREAYFNGERIGGSGTFPPQFRSGLGGSGRITVPARLVRFGEPNVVAIRVYQKDGRGGFNVAAPVLFGGERAIRLEGEWQFRAGDDVAWAKWQERPAALAAYAKLDSAEEVNRTLKKLDGDAGPLTAAESLQRFQVPGDLKIELVLSEPEIGQPLSMKFDERGRLLVVQYLQYPTPAGLKMLSRDKFLRSVYDKVPPAPPNHFRGADKITIHEDTNGDGVLDKHKTFVEGLSLVSSFARGRGGVWVLNPPYLLFYPDRNNDDVPDGDPEVHLEGFGLEDSHSVANSLRWGPDGWLYAAQGSTVSGDIKRPGLDKTGVHSMGQLIWRYHPETRRYEIFAEGGGNAFGVEIDSKGRIYSGHNGGDTRGFHYVQGGYFQKGFGKHGPLSNPYTFGYFPPMAHPKVPRFTHTYIIYEGGALSGQYTGKLFGVAPLQSHVIYSEIEPDGSTFKSHDLGHAATSTDPWFRPVDIQVGPDGAIYVADFYEQRIDHASHYQGRVDKGSGRIYRLKAKDAPPASPFDLGKLTTRELIDTLRHENKWYRQTALQLLGDRKDTSVVSLLRQLIGENEGQFALETLWALHLCGGLDDATALKTLDHADPYVRLWTVRLLCDNEDVSKDVAKKLADMSLREPNVEARSQLACSARRLPAAESLAIVRNLLTRSEDVADIHIPLLLWWAIEAKVPGGRESFSSPADTATNGAQTKKTPDPVLVMFQDPSLWNQPLVEQHILERLMRRYAAAGTRKDLLSCATLLQLAPSPQYGKRLMAGFEAAYSGRSLTGLPSELIAAIAKVGGVSLALRLRQGDAAALDEALKIIADEQAKSGDRLQLIQIFGEIQQPRCVPVLLQVAEQSKDTPVRSGALGALQAYDDAKIAAEVVRLYNMLPDDSRSVAQSLLASRVSWSLALLKAIDAGRVARESVPMPVVRRILLHPDEQLAALVRNQWGDVQGATTAEMRDEIERLIAVIDKGSGNPYEGKQLYRSSCGKCHELFEEGGQIGPSLSAYQRDDLGAMLLNVVNPSAQIREGFENYALFTDDGRTLTGFIADQDNQVVILRGIDGQTLVVPRGQIEDLRALPQSLMPEGLLKTLSNQQVRDLFAYLRSTQPLP